MSGKKSRPYPLEFRERAVRLVLEARGEGGGHEATRRIAEQLDVKVDTLRHWVKQAAIDRGERPGTTTADHKRIVELEREVRELRRSNEILKSASAFFGAALDRRGKW